MIPYKTALVVNRLSKQPIYIQLTNQFIDLIKHGKLTPKAKLPGSRTLSEMLGLHRKTIVACYEELTMQGWIVSLPQKGTFVNADLPVLKLKGLGETINSCDDRISGFEFEKNQRLTRNFPQSFHDDYLYVNDGIADSRLAPTKDVAMIYRNCVAKKSAIKHLSYGTTYGNVTLREVLVTYLNETRGLNISIDNIMITRGSQMGMFLASQLLFNKQDYVIIGETNYSSSDTTFEYAGAQLLRVKVDDHGLDMNNIELLCKRYKIKAVYTTSHHHHPTAVTLSAERRIQLLNLAKIHKFAIIEDDYDYDFHYNHAPILPLASHDENGHVIYVGSVCKTVAPVYRIGYLIASKDFVDECAKLRRFVDRQGDALLELTFAKFIKEGYLDRHIKKVLRVYKARRDLFCSLLKTELNDYVSFDIPKGGMATWITLNKKYSWDKVSEKALAQKLVITEWQRYDTANVKHNSIRMGFAAYNEQEIYEFVKRLKRAFMTLS
ncbi:MocR-like pyridoxine biosynthesis transcription factor PdxR [Algibacter mikhailovii]|uniref:GntR family transcriptional regulator n=1 Tax=Algibacter mikhailovii TaxID=425498 RepID=A0A918RDI9_9FLAO|nr:PLP-dependent aminotransferase family protein [Algibacter mikhailovii]GGZ91421.1 GntR family transcriptional regulator [Algibacter mikhailovii]